jgi:HK97 family phage portal protein
VSILGRVLDGTRGATLQNPPDWLLAALGAEKSSTGEVVSVQNALGLVPVYSAVSQIAGAIGSLPLIVYRSLDDGSAERAPLHRTWSLLHDLPNREMAADEVWELVTSHLNLWGNAFVYKERDGADNLAGLWPLRPDRVVIERDPEGNRAFLVDGKGPYYEDTILHIRGLSPDGLIGYSPIQIAREQLGTMLAQQRFQSEFNANGGRPRVILRHPNQLSPEAAKRLKTSWDSIKSGGTAVLEENIALERWTMPLQDAQFVEQMQFSDLRIAQLFQLPPSRLGTKTGDSMTYTNTESAGIDYVTYTLRRWLTRIERSLARDPDIFTQGTRFYCEFLVEGLLRGDSGARSGYYTAALNPDTGWMTRQEVRARENLPQEKTTNG